MEELLGAQITQLEDERSDLEIVNADLSNAASLVVLIAYNLAYAVVFASVPVLIWLLGERAQPLLEKINGYMVKGADLFMPWIMLALGLGLMSDAVYFFVTGDPLFNVGSAPVPD